MYTERWLSSTPRSLSSSLICAATTCRLTSAYRFVVAADLSGDGRDDLMSSGADAFEFFRNTGAGVYVRPSRLPTSSPYGSFSLADFDHNGTPEVLVGRAGGLDVWAMGSPTAINVGYAQPRYVVVEDFDGDLDLDMFWVDGAAGHWNSLLLQTLSGWQDVTATHLPGRRGTPGGPMSTMFFEILGSR